MTYQERFAQYRDEHGIRDVGVEFFDEEDPQRVRIPFKTAPPSYQTAHSLMMRVPKEFLSRIGLARPDKPSYIFACDGYCYLKFPIASQRQPVTIEPKMYYGTQNTYG